MSKPNYLKYSLEEIAFELSDYITAQDAEWDCLAEWCRDNDIPYLPDSEELDYWNKIDHICALTRILHLNKKLYVNNKKKRK